MFGIGLSNCINASFVKKRALAKTNENNIDSLQGVLYFLIFKDFSSFYHTEHVMY